jgi:two-component system phosphate regulon response regulator PhoB
VPEGQNDPGLLRRPVEGRARILVAQDEPAMNEILVYVLGAEGYEVTVARSGDEALRQVDSMFPDLAIVDRALSAISGLEFTRRLRRDKATRDLPVILLVHRGEEQSSGTEDTLVKPFSLSELLARVRAALRRSKPSFSSELLTYANIVVDLEYRRVLRNGQPVHLGPTEFRLLCALLERPGRVFTRNQLRDAVCDQSVSARTIDVYIRRLRMALNRPGEVDVIRTVRSAGYALDELAPSRMEPASY